MSTTAKSPEHKEYTCEVSVIIPTYNRGSLLVDLLQSLEKQTFPADRFEVIVVDNGSADNTAELVSEFMRDTSLDISFHRKNFNGPSASRDFAVGISRGGIIAFIDSDCVATPRWLEEGVESFGESVALVQGMTLPNPDQPRYILDRTVSVTKEGPFYETCNIFYKKSVYEEMDGFSPEYEEFGYPYFGEDLDLAWRIKCSGYGSAFADQALVYHHVFRLTFWQWFTEPRNAMTWPYMVKKFPFLRKQMFARYFLLKMTAYFDLFVAGVAGALLLHWSLIVLALPYAVTKYLDAKKGTPWFLRIGRFVLCLPRASVLFFTLLYGSIRFRSFLL